MTTCSLFIFSLGYLPSHNLLVYDLLHRLLIRKAGAKCDPEEGEVPQRKEIFILVDNGIFSEPIPLGQAAVNGVVGRGQDYGHPKEALGPVEVPAGHVGYAVDGGLLGQLGCPVVKVVRLLRFDVLGLHDELNGSSSLTTPTIPLIPSNVHDLVN